MARFTVSVSDEVKERLDAFAEEKGYNRSEALELMIRKFFAEPGEEPVVEEPAEEVPKGDVAEVWEFLKAQHEYLVQLHDVVVDNAQAATELVPSYEETEFFVPVMEPPKPGG